MIEEVQSIQISEPKCIAIMSREKEHEGPSSEEEEFKKAFYTLTEMVKVHYEERNTIMVGESSKPPHGEGRSKEKNMRRRIPKGMVESHLHLHHPHHLPHHIHHITQHHLPLPPLKLPILIQKHQKERLPYITWT